MRRRVESAEYGEREVRRAIANGMAVLMAYYDPHPFTARIAALCLMPAVDVRHHSPLAPVAADAADE